MGILVKQFNDMWQVGIKEVWKTTVKEEKLVSFLNENSVDYDVRFNVDKEMFITINTALMFALVGDMQIFFDKVIDKKIKYGQIRNKVMNL